MKDLQNKYGISREKNSEESLNPGWEILSSPPDDVARSWLSKPVVAKDSDCVPTEDEVL